MYTTVQKQSTKSALKSIKKLIRRNLYFMFAKCTNGYSLNFISFEQNLELG